MRDMAMLHQPSTNAYDFPYSASMDLYRGVR